MTLCRIITWRVCNQCCPQKSHFVTHLIKSSCSTERWLRSIINAPWTIVWIATRPWNKPIVTNGRESSMIERQRRRRISILCGKPKKCIWKIELVSERCWRMRDAKYGNDRLVKRLIKSSRTLSRRSVSVWSAIQRNAKTTLRSSRTNSYEIRRTEISPLPSKIKPRWRKRQTSVPLQQS